MYLLYIFAFLIILLSFTKDKDKTLKGFKVAWKKFKNILPSFTKMLIAVSVVLYFIPESLISKYLGGSSILGGTFLGSFFGSITILPGFVAFPLSSVLIDKGVSYTAIASFTTTLMLVGIVTFPVEKDYFGWKLSIFRNIVSYLICILIAFVIGIFYGEISL
jgi:uncharacterized membrane protein YraQ (UPF0718 family)